MKTKRFVFLFVLCAMFSTSLFAGCFENVVPAAWFELKSDTGYVVYTTDMYGSYHDHVYLFENQEDASDYDNAILSIKFYPRILGPDEIDIDGVVHKTTIVDISNNYEMRVYVNKNSYIYSESKDFYLNDQKLVASNIYDGTTLKGFTFTDINFIRGNPGGHINNTINMFEYK